MYQNISLGIECEAFLQHCLACLRFLRNIIFMSNDIIFRFVFKVKFLNTSTKPFFLWILSPPASVISHLIM